jgi:hypothetical protein
MKNTGEVRANWFHFFGINVNYMLAEEGWCWWYRKYAPRERGVKTAGDRGERRQERLVGGPESRVGSVGRGTKSWEGKSTSRLHADQRREDISNDPFILSS